MRPSIRIYLVCRDLVPGNVTDPAGLLCDLIATSRSSWITKRLMVMLNSMCSPADPNTACSLGLRASCIIFLVQWDRALDVYDCSLTGAVFLAAFGVWGSILAVDARRGGNGSRTTTYEPRGSLRGKVATSLWSFVAALACIVFISQVNVSLRSHGGGDTLCVSTQFPMIGLHYTAGDQAGWLGTQVALQAAYHVGHMTWAETENVRLVLQLLGFPRVRNSWDFALVRCA